VTGPDGQEIYTDEFWRVRVKLPWDRQGGSDDWSSCWMRVSQGFAGSAYGMMHVPRIGEEVLVAFVDDNPDQPVVVGRLYNQGEPVPYALPGDKTKSTWKSDSSPRTGGFNELMFDDLRGDELVYAQAEKNRRALVKNDATLTVGHDRDKQVGANETDTTGNDRIEVTGANRSQEVGGSRTTVIGGDRARLTKGKEDEVTEGDHLLTVVGNRHVVVKGEKRERRELDSHLHVKGNRNEQVDGTRSLGTSSLQVKVGKKAGIEAGDEIHLVTPKVMVGEAAADLTVSGPGGFLRIDASGVTIVGTLVQINVGGSAGSGAGAHPAKPAEPTSAPVSAPAAITSQTVASGSTNRSRTKVGVGEEVTLTYSTGSASWTVSGGGTVTPASGNTTTFRAGERNATATITANGSDGTTTITIQVVEPTGFVMEQAPGTGLKHTSGRPDCGFKGQMFLQPIDVSFEDIEVRELNSNSTANGFYAPFNNITHQPASQTASAWFTVNAPSGGKGSSPNMNDQIYSGDPGGGPPWTAGSLVFPCTWEFRVRGGSAKTITTVQHTQQVDTAGTCTNSKAGTSKSRVPSDPTSSW
jgi:phage baseplate assembly protein gpV